MSATDGKKSTLAFDLSLFYFCAYGASGALIPFLPLVLSDRGFGAQAISTVMIVAPIGHLLVPPLWGMLADHFEARLGLLRLATLGGAAGTLALYPAHSLTQALAAMVLYCVFRTPIFPLVDATSVASLGEQRGRYARIRVWGSIGFALFATLAGHLGGSSRAQLLFFGSAGLQLLSTVATLRFVAGQPQPKRSLLPELFGFLTTGPMPLLLIGTAVYYGAHSTYDIYYGLHLRAAGHGDGFVGLALGLGVLAEVLVMFAAPRLLDRFDPYWFLVGAGGVAALRWSLLAFVTGAPLLLLLQPLHGITFGAWFVALVKLIQDRAPARLRTSVQAVIMASLGLGTILGYGAGGPAYELGGGALVFGAAGVASGLAVVIYGLAFRNSRRQSPAA